MHLIPQELAMPAVALLITWGPKLVTALILLAVFWVLSGWSARLIRAWAGTPETGPRPVFDLLASCARYGLLILGVVTAMGALGINVNAIVASLGLTGFALGFALKDALSNLLAGAMILVYQPYYHGDKIKVQTFEGVVTKIDLRYTTLDSGSEKFLIPNSVMLNNAITLFAPPAET